MGGQAGTQNGFQPACVGFALDASDRVFRRGAQMSDALEQLREEATMLRERLAAAAGSTAGEGVAAAVAATPGPVGRREATGCEADVTATTASGASAAVAVTTAGSVAATPCLVRMTQALPSSTLRTVDRAANVEKRVAAMNKVRGVLAFMGTPT